MAFILIEFSRVSSTATYLALYSAKFYASSLTSSLSRISCKLIKSIWCGVMLQNQKHERTQNRIHKPIRTDKHTLYIQCNGNIYVAWIKRFLGNLQMIFVYLIQVTNNNHHSTNNHNNLHQEQQPQHNHHQHVPSPISSNNEIDNLSNSNNNNSSSLNNNANTAPNNTDNTAIGTDIQDAEQQHRLR